MPDSLSAYRQKRDFGITPEPRGTTVKAGDALAFVVQKHAASRLHYDFRLELEGTLKSWAVPKGPSLDPSQKRMAVHVEDHPLAYGSFEGVIPPNQYGSGNVIVWDRGTWEPVGDASAGYRAGKLKFRLDGEKLHGVWNLVKMRARAGERQEPWLLIKERDDHARPAAEYDIVVALPVSVVSGREVDALGDPPAAAPAPRRRRSAAAKLGKTASAAKTTARAEIELPDGAVAAALPATLAPELATLVGAAPEGEGWAYEVKFDGYRILARVDGAEVRLITRNGNDWTAKLQSLAAEIGRLGLPSGWLDGEIVVLGEHGNSDFGALQNAFEFGADKIRYFVFDLPYCNGFDLRGVALVERRALLKKLLGEPGDKVRYSEDFDAAADDILRHACRMHLEGIIGKRLDSRYVGGRSRDWIKLKCTLRQEFVIGGYTEPRGSRAGLGALLLGIHDAAGKLRFAGSVGTGFDTRTLLALRKQLSALDAAGTPFVDKPREARGSWVEPKLIAEVSFAEWTKDGKVRHAVFHGLRSDKPPTAITRERPAPTPKGAKADTGTPAPTRKRAAEAPVTETAPVATLRKRPPKSAVEPAPPVSRSAAAPVSRRAAALPTSVRITHPERVIDSSTQRTKQDLVDYYVHAARRILPHLKQRPVALVRAPAGVAGQHFFQKHSGSLRIDELVELPAALDPGHPALIEIDSFTALISAAQMNVVEFHTWNATSRQIEKPDRMTFDLDPGEGVQWPQLVEAARLIHALLEELSLRAFVKTSGGKGLHIVVPLSPREGWEEVKDFSHAVVDRLAVLAPQLLVAKSGAKNRVGKIFVDYLRNGRGATTAAAFSARARAGLGVSVPCGWDELDGLSGGDHWNIATVHERLESSVDPWADYGGVRQMLSRARKTLTAGVPG